NYRMSNILAAIGRGQIRVLHERVEARRRNFQFYRDALADLPGITFMPQASYGLSNNWLTCITIDADAFGASRYDVQRSLDAANIESRPVWKPLHLQPVFAGCAYRGGTVAGDLFEHGLCLPSGSSLTDEDWARVVGVIRAVHEKCAAPALAR
ncbi:MAG: DegT/DnrJ/EryC1/StrS family aminotransferase, partial [Planctomycetes bacterium]|nr:DegT/DnrJ/EryC1/StrS family aminotransferase [Planctomycetota bacterium]